MPAMITAVMIAYSTVSRPRSSEMKLFKSFLIGDPSFTDVSITIAAHNSNRKELESRPKLSTVLPYNQPTIQRKNPYSPRLYYTGQILCVKAKTIG